MAFVGISVQSILVDHLIKGPTQGELSKVAVHVLAKSYILGPLRPKYFLANLMTLYHLLETASLSNPKPVREQDSRIEEVSMKRRSSLCFFLGCTAVGLVPAPVHLWAGSPVSLLQDGRLWSPLL